MTHGLALFQFSGNETEFSETFQIVKKLAANEGRFS